MEIVSRSNEHETNVKHLISTWRCRKKGPPKHWYPTVTLHGVTTQKTSTWTL